MDRIIEDPRGHPEEWKHLGELFRNEVTERLNSMKPQLIESGVQITTEAIEGGERRVYDVSNLSLPYIPTVENLQRTSLKTLNEYLAPYVADYIRAILNLAYAAVWHEFLAEYDVLIASENETYSDNDRRFKNWNFVVY